MKKTAFLWIGAGTVLIVFMIGSMLLDYRAEKLLLASLDQQALYASGMQRDEKQAAEESEDEANAEADENGADPNKESEQGWDDGTGQGVGILTIDSINLKVPVKEGIDKKTLRTAVGHIPGTAAIGEQGNCAIAGHRNYSFGRFFNRLNEVKLGELITITTSEGKTYYYEVTQSFVVEPEDVSVLEATQESEITLITCTPIYLATHRLIMKAKLI